jgi:cell division protein FtsB
MSVSVDQRAGPGAKPGPEAGPRLTEPPPPMAVPQARFVVLVLLVVVSGVLGILLLNTKINENAFVLHELRQEQAELDQRQQELEREIAAAKSPTALAAAARRLGLVDRREDLEHLPVAEQPADRVADQPEEQADNQAAEG